MYIRKTLTADELRDALTYDEESGEFYWIHGAKGRFAGAKAGNKRPDGYKRINVNGHLYYAHRLAWLYMTGEWPEHQVDHVNMNPQDNSWKNLRAATPSQNRGNRRVQSNSWTGVKGVHFREDMKKWMAYISPNGKLKTLGYFSTLEEAKEARSKAAREFFGDFSRDE